MTAASTELDGNGWFGEPVANSTRRKYKLLRPGVDFGEITVFSDFIDTPEPQRWQYFKAELARAIEADRLLRSA